MPPKLPKNSFYWEDLAYVHDQAFGDFAHKATPEIIKIFQGRNLFTGLIIDLGCGSGISSKLLDEANYQVLGVDCSEAMLDLARIHAPKVDYCLASFVDFNWPTCSAVLALGECLNYQFDEHTQEEFEIILKKIYRVLLPGGMLIMDLLVPGKHSLTWQHTFIEGLDWTLCLSKREDQRTNILTRKIILYRHLPNSIRRSEETHLARLYSAGWVSSVLRKIGFKVRVAKRYGNYPLRDAVRAYIAYKPLI